MISIYKLQNNVMWMQCLIMFSFKRKYVRDYIWCNNNHFFNLKVKALKHYHIDSIIENVQIYLNVMSIQSITMINKISKHTMSPLSQVTNLDLNKTLVKMTFFHHSYHHFLLHFLPSICCVWVWPFIPNLSQVLRFLIQ
jgi:hypothetical protein